MLHLFANNGQCKHIFYACGPDAQSLSALDNYRNNFIVSSSITLIKSKPFEDHDIYLPFEIMEIPSLFEKDKKETKSTSVSELLRSSPSKSNERPRTRARGSRGANRRQSDRRQSVPSTALESTWGPETNNILLNIDNQRVDSQLGKLDPKAIDSYKKRTNKKKVCKWYHLDGVCLNGSSCTYSHGPRLNAAELEVLRAKNRERPCENGSTCRNPRCHYGHMCPEFLCSRGNLCKFRHLHGISRDAITVYSSSNDYVVTDTSTGAEVSTDSSGKAIQARGRKEAVVDNAFNFHVPSTILAPRNPNIPEDQDMGETEEAVEAVPEEVLEDAGEPYKRHFTKRSKDV